MYEDWWNQCFEDARLYQVRDPSKIELFWLKLWADTKLLTPQTLLEISANRPFAMINSTKELQYSKVQRHSVTTVGPNRVASKSQPAFRQSCLQQSIWSIWSSYNITNTISAKNYPYCKERCCCRKNLQIRDPERAEAARVSVRRKWQFHFVSVCVWGGVVDNQPPKLGVRPTTSSIVYFIFHFSHFKNIFLDRWRTTRTRSLWKWASNSLSLSTW